MNDFERDVHLLKENLRNCTRFSQVFLTTNTFSLDPSWQNVHAVILSIATLHPGQHQIEPAHPECSQDKCDSATSSLQIAIAGHVINLNHSPLPVH